MENAAAGSHNTFMKGTPGSGKTMLERWYDFGRIDWATELEYPEFTMKQTQQLLTLTH
jgi:hypothetical protein